jgi:hypothetical protein
MLKKEWSLTFLISIDCFAYSLYSEIAKSGNTTQMTGRLEMRKLRVGVHSGWMTRWKAIVFRNVLLRRW